MYFNQIERATRLLLITLIFTLSACGGGYTTNTANNGGNGNSQTDANRVTVSANSAGAILYEEHCADCHLGITAGVKTDRSADAIQAAIIEIPAMQNITITSEELALIADALSSSSIDQLNLQNENASAEDENTNEEDSFSRDDTDNSADNTDQQDTDNNRTDNNSGAVLLAEIQALMAEPELNCTNSSCHDSTPGSARINLKTGDLSDFVARLVDQSSASARCADEQLINSTNAQDSLLLKLIDPDSGSQCMSKMPFGRAGIPTQALDKFREWVDLLIATANLPIVERPNTSNDNTSGDDNNTQDNNSISERNNPLAPDAIQYVEQSPLILGRKIKYLLHGGALTNQELKVLTATDGTLNKDGLDLLISDWMNTEAYEQKISNFLAVTLQQTPANDRYENQLGRLSNNSVSRAIRENLRDSFVRTALRIINQDESFKQVITTQQWEVTTGVLTALAYADDHRRRDVNFRDIPLEPSDFTDWRTVNIIKVNTSPYEQTSFGTAAVVNALRGITEGGTLSLLAPRVGFFNTLAFQEQWQTNADNQFRLNTNQTLIAALQMTFESGDPTEPHHSEGLNSEHAPNGTDCFGCHKNLDPMRNIFYNHYEPNNHRARRSPLTVTPDFAFQGHRVPVTNMAQFAAALSNHPRFAMAWTEKVCQWFTSMPCDQQDPEMIRLAQHFERSDYAFNALVRALITSSYLTQTTFDASAIVPHNRVSIARGNHYCHAIFQRLSDIRKRHNFPAVDNDTTTDLCARSSGNIQLAASIIPRDGVTRGQTHLVQPSENDMMLAKAYDAFCDRSSVAVVGSNDNTSFRNNDIDTALDDMTEIILGIPSSANTYSDARSALSNLYALGRATPICENDTELRQSSNGNPACGLGLNQTNSLRLVWRTACQSPDLTGIGL